MALAMQMVARQRTALKCSVCRLIIDEAMPDPTVLGGGRMVRAEFLMDIGLCPACRTVVCSSGQMSRQRRAALLRGLARLRRKEGR